MLPRTQLPHGLVFDLIRAGLFDTLDERRRLLWALGEVRYETAGRAIDTEPAEVGLPQLGALESTVWDYALTGLSASGQLMRHFRPALERAGVMSTAQVRTQKAGVRVRVAGMQAVRQMPGTAKGVVFISCEDEHGLLDIVLQPRTWERFRLTLKSEALFIFDGIVQQTSGATSVLAGNVSGLGA